MSAREALRRLDEHQQGAVATFRELPAGSVVKTRAVAGAGKTSTIVAWVACAIELDRVQPRDICLTTFTRKAADELRERVLRVLPGPVVDQMRIGTFHSIGRRLLESQGERWPMSRCLDVASDVPRSRDVWDSIVQWRREGVYGTGAKSLSLEYDVGSVMLAVDVARSRHQKPTDAAFIEACITDGMPELPAAWAAYNAAKLALRAWDFGDVLEALHDAAVGGRLPAPAYLVVDEAQDNSRIQLDIALAWAKAGRLILVGDERQAIYSWRGAEPSIFERAQEDLGAWLIELPNNYRSGPAVVSMGNRIASAFGVTVPAVARGGTQDVVRRLEAEDGIDEAAHVAGEIAERIQAGASPAEIAILVRTNAGAAAFEGALMTAGVPCVRVGGTPFFERGDVLAFIAYAILSRYDSFDALVRVKNRPKRYLSRAWEQAVSTQLDTGAPLLTAIATAGARVGLKGKPRDAARELATTIGGLRRMSWPAATHAIAKLLLRDQPAKTDNDDLGGIPAVCAGLARRFAGPVEFAQYADAAAKNGRAEKGAQDDKPRVTISTVHRAKGREWPVVYVSIPDGEFPHPKCEPVDELRLGYVAVTRAMRELVLTYPRASLDHNAKCGASKLLDYADE